MIIPYCKHFSMILDRDIAVKTTLIFSSFFYKKKNMPFLVTNGAKIKISLNEQAAGKGGFKMINPYSLSRR